MQSSWTWIETATLTARGHIFTNRIVIWNFLDIISHNIFKKICNFFYEINNNCAHNSKENKFFHITQVCPKGAD